MCQPYYHHQLAVVYIHPDANFKICTTGLFPRCICLYKSMNIDIRMYVKIVYIAPFYSFNQPRFSSSWNFYHHKSSALDSTSIWSR